MRALKKVVIWEDLVELTGDYRDSAILSQLLYWLQRMKDTDTYLAAERERMARNGIYSAIDLTNGWIYKTAEELSEETMMGLAVSTIRKCLQRLVDRGWVEQRHNPKYKWDRTWQYRVDLVQLERDLRAMAKGYTLAAHGIVLDATDDNAFSSGENGNACGENGFSTSRNRSTKSSRSNVAGKEAIPDSTSENTSESISSNNKKQESVVVENDGPIVLIERALGTTLSKADRISLKEWLTQYTREQLLEWAEYARENATKSVVGMFRQAVTSRWVVTLPEQAAPQDSQVRDPRYRAFYALYPDG